MTLSKYFYYCFYFGLMTSEYDQYILKTHGSLLEAFLLKNPLHNQLGHNTITNLGDMANTTTTNKSVY